MSRGKEGSEVSYERKLAKMVEDIEKIKGFYDNPFNSLDEVRDENLESDFLDKIDFLKDIVTISDRNPFNKITDLEGAKKIIRFVFTNSSASSAKTDLLITKELGKELGKPLEGIESSEEVHFKALYNKLVRIIEDDLERAIEEGRDIKVSEKSSKVYEDDIKNTEEKIEAIEEEIKAIEEKIKADKEEIKDLEEKFEAVKREIEIKKAEIKEAEIKEAAINLSKEFSKAVDTNYVKQAQEFHQSYDKGEFDLKVFESLQKNYLKDNTGEVAYHLTVVFHDLLRRHKEEELSTNISKEAVMEMLKDSVEDFEYKKEVCPQALNFWGVLMLAALESEKKDRWAEGGEAEISQEAFKYFEKATETEYPPAINNLALCYEKGIGVVANPRQAFALYKQAHEAGEKTATQNLIRCYRDGVGVEQNENNVRIVTQMCIGLTSPDQETNNFAKCALADLLLKERVARELYKQKKLEKNSESLYQEAAESGYTEAYVRLGMMRMNEKKYYKAFESFKAGSEAGNAECSYQAGLLLISSNAPDVTNQEGHSLNANNKKDEAIKLIKLADQQGHTSALKELEEGVLKDRIDAKRRSSLGSVQAALEKASEEVSRNPFDVYDQEPEFIYWKFKGIPRDQISIEEPEKIGRFLLKAAVETFKEQVPATGVSATASSAVSAGNGLGNGLGGWSS